MEIETLLVYIILIAIIVNIILYMCTYSKRKKGFIETEISGVVSNIIMTTIFIAIPFAFVTFNNEDTITKLAVNIESVVFDSKKDTYMNNCPFIVNTVGDTQTIRPTYVRYEYGIDVPYVVNVTYTPSKNFKLLKETRMELVLDKKYEHYGESVIYSNNSKSSTLYANAVIYQK